MSALPQKRTLAGSSSMSAKCQYRTFRHSFDHLGRTPDYRVGDVDAKRLYGLQVSLPLLSILVRTPDQMQLTNIVTIPCE